MSLRPDKNKFMLGRSLIICLSILIKQIYAYNNQANETKVTLKCPPISIENQTVTDNYKF